MNVVVERDSQTANASSAKIAPLTRATRRRSPGTWSTGMLTGRVLRDASRCTGVASVTFRWLCDSSRQVDRRRLGITLLLYGEHTARALVGKCRFTG